MLSDYAPVAILFTPGGPLVGADAMRPLYEGLIAEFAKPGSSFELKLQSIEGDYAYILWTAETADNSYDLVTDTFVVKDGKIVAQSFAAKILPKR
ncbi:MAG: nuclear transport factor 2 family protein [Desulfobacterales bacterium]